MASGAVLAEGPMAQLQSNQAVIDAYLGGERAR
jgi:ABC-type branched-subunit amino acid transport system ATPase component